MKRKAIISAVLIVAILSAVVSTLVFFLKKPKDDIVPDIFQIENYQTPANLPDYALKLQWVNSKGEPTTFNPNRGVMILFDGVSYYDQKESLKLDEEIYYYSGVTTTDGALGLNSANIDTELAFYWQRMGFNVGIFHYENFADDTAQNLNKKLYNKSAMTYKDKDGNAVTQNLPEYTLTQAFVMEWLKLMQVSPIGAPQGSTPPYHNIEVRFVGNGSGANLAVAAADYLYDLYYRGHISGSFVPARISLLNPHLDNTEINIPVQYKNGTVAKSVLDYNATLIQKLADNGAVFEMIESDREFFLSYQHPYTGLVEVLDDTENGANTESESEETEEQEKIINYTLGDTGDAELYKKIQKQTAYLEFQEEYSNYYTEEYKALDRAVRDWYLYSINGSDDSAMSNQTTNGYNGTYPMMDSRNSDGYYGSYVRYSVSAWTPTSYIRALRGVNFKMLRYIWSQADGKSMPNPYILPKFLAENYQSSDLTQVSVAGYVYWRKYDTVYVNYGLDARLEGITVRVTVELDSSGNQTVVLEGKTDKGGFYNIALRPEHFEKTLRIEVVLPSRYYDYSGMLTSPSEYHKLSLSSLGGSSNTGSTVSRTLGHCIIRNAGLIKKEG
ncbi:MAG: hypothetical protein WC292_04740 [Clostridia bacterium]